MKVFVSTLLTLLLLGACAQGFTGKLEVPPKDKTQMITMQDGSTLVGRITAIGDSDVKFQTDMGEMTIVIAKIREIKEVSVSSIKGGQYWFPNPNRTRLLWGPTARTLDAGKGYFYDLWIFFPGLAYGITDNFMIAGGASIIPGVDNQMFYVMPKLGFAAGKNLDLAVSLQAFRLWDETFYFGLGNMTYGTDDRSITCGLGVAFTDEKMADKPAATLGGECRLSRRTALVGESWFIPGDADEGVLAIGALRLFGEQLTVDIGVGLSLESNSVDVTAEDEIDWLPYVDFVWNF
jgi:hypothetical protein